MYDRRHYMDLVLAFNVRKNQLPKRIKMRKNGLVNGCLSVLGLLLTFSACSDGDVKDIYQGGSSNIYVSDTNWSEAANQSTAAYIEYFFKNNDKALFADNVYWEQPNTPESGTPATTLGGGGIAQSHAMDIVLDSYIRHSDDPSYQSDLVNNVIKPFLPALEAWNQSFVYGGPNFQNYSIEGLEWLALTCLRVYNVTGESGYRDAVDKMWPQIKQGKNNYKGVGGIAWFVPMPETRYAASNGPGCLLAMKLYQLAVKENKSAEAAEYLAFAKEVYQWMTASLSDTSSGQVYQNLSINADGIPSDPNRTAYSHNQGTFMASALALYNATGESEYLRNAVAFATYQVTKKMDANYPVFSGEGNSGDNLFFRAVYVRYLLDMLKQPVATLYTEKAKNKLANALMTCADVVWEQAHPEKQYVWEYSWSTPPKFGNRGDDNRLQIELNAEIAGATLMEIRARYDDWVNQKASEEPNWVGPDFQEDTEETSDTI
jgi:predicted alpha-1,6-mannanase (GH76 family)